ncbi:hypothetical protein KGM_202923B, partial [Danaus plexippus plexippus]
HCIVDLDPRSSSDVYDGPMPFSRDFR